MVEKTYKIILSKSVRDRLKQISDYYKRAASEQVSKKIRNGLLEAIKDLEKLPESKATLKLEKKVVTPYRYTSKWSFKIIYQVIKESETVRVLAIIHDKENHEKWEKV